MKFRSTLLVFATIFTICFSACSKEAKIDKSRLPAGITRFVSQHFGNQTVKNVIVDNEDAIPEYDIVFANGTKVEIDSTGAWKEVSNKSAAVPVTMLPDTTQSFIKTNYPNDKVMKVEKEMNGYEVKLSNGIELKFAADGTFIKIDR